MRNTAELVLSTVKPRVFWGENAPALFTNKGQLVAKSLRDIASKYGYSLMLYHTKSMLHGTPQIRARTFYLFFKGDKLPVFNYYKTPYVKIEDLLDSVKAKDDPINKKVPSQDDAVYRYLLESMSMTHAQYQKSLKKTVSVHSYVFEHHLEKLSKWARENDEKKLLHKAAYVKEKFRLGQGAWLKNTTVPRDHIGAFVGHMPLFMTHHEKDRYITLSEAKAIMGLPKDFILLDPKQSINHLCQNVPVKTAEDMTKEIVASLNGEREWLKASFAKQCNVKQMHHRQTIQLSLF
jgi:site-specific DNA-cytosine methylase